jgi:nucleotide-binding universal stress UspA family protein
MSSGIPHNSIVHPTDFSDLSIDAFAHAMRIAVATKSKLYVLHVAQDEIAGELAFPHARRLLVQWGLLEDDDPSSAIVAKLGIQIENVRMVGHNPTQSIASFLERHPSDLVVFATHGRDGIQSWLKGSVSETVLRWSAIPALFISPSSHGFISQVSGDITLRRVLIPVDFSPAPGEAIQTVQQLVALLASANVVLHILHVGTSAPSFDVASTDTIFVPPVLMRSGDVVESIIGTALEFEVDLIGMPTAGHRGILDAIRGSTTERVIRHAPCPVLAIPAQ